MLCTSDIFVLITYCSIVESFFIMISVAGMLWLRYKRPDMERPVKVIYKIRSCAKNLDFCIRVSYIRNKTFYLCQVPLWIPIMFVAICAFLVIVPCYERPYEVGMGLLITVSGVPAYFIGVVWRDKPLWFQKINGLLIFVYTTMRIIQIM